ncbi:MAG: 50S ribosomal protein L3 [Candidatus Magasanikbacteria bacterium CG10_big_fil_rev_8_21_14_0_10_40_10]|uniref:Large ribosomal subunit protein uL3 n=1 Tax=Candidatus Magasanikbacteria bacterium CG10_big_fil_rev_8_21_14_0_10_40_10 TaxID=1974648 RepID=A0A2M6W5A3_9BACT|nr:MAG: 50S ribosomal protein L3 [Candidatus Magasanikbacteria bacterium CG10_big_fil_rev_8_21_14_0_10_40_10]
MKFILGKKLGMTQVFQPDGNVVPVTRVKCGPCVITQIKAKNIQIGFEPVKEKNLAKPQIGHLKDLDKVRVLCEFKVDEAQTKDLSRGNCISIESFVTGDKVSVTGTSKGKGFQGVVKRHGFHGSPASHGHKDQLRMPGSIGAGGPQHVFKGTRMGGHMGSGQVTVKNLEIIVVKPEENELYIKGAVPGARNGVLKITAQGDLKILDDKKAEVEIVETKEAEEIKTEQASEEVVVQTEPKEAEKDTKKE